MRDIGRIKRILSLLEKIWLKQPDTRFGQLLINLGIVIDEFRLWNNEDDGLEEFLKIDNNKEYKFVWGQKPQLKNG